MATIEKGIPLPVRNANKRSDQYEVLFDLEPGDSVVFGVKPPAIRKWTKRVEQQTGAKFVARLEGEDTTRVWRKS